jgi:hypothetical protein
MTKGPTRIEVLGCIWKGRTPRSFRHDIAKCLTRLDCAYGGVDGVGRIRRELQCGRSVLVAEVCWERL